jgi:hypothetical protein
MTACELLDGKNGGILGTDEFSAACGSYCEFNVEDRLRYDGWLSEYIRECVQEERVSK